MKKQFKNVIKTIIISIMLLVSYQGFSSTDVLQRKVIQIMSSDDILRKEQHDEFWQLMEKSFTPSQQQKFVGIIEQNLDTALIYQEAMYEAMIESFIQRKVIRTEKLKKIKEKLEQAFIDSLPYPKDSEEFNQALDGWKSNNQADKNLTMMLEHSAKRENMVLPGRGEFEISEENLRAVRNSISFKMHKLKKLLNSEWVTE